MGAGPVEACRAQVADFGGSGPCALIGGGKANPIDTAFWHTALVRYVDFMDNFLAPTETCHTADNFGVAYSTRLIFGLLGVKCQEVNLRQADAYLKVKSGEIAATNWPRDTDQYQRVAKFIARQISPHHSRPDLNTYFGQIIEFAGPAAKFATSGAHRIGPLAVWAED